MVSIAWGCGNGRVDPGEVVTLSPEEEWNAEEREILASAGEAWNEEFGTRLQLSAEEALGEQLVGIWFTGEGCMNDQFRRTHARASIDPPEIRICPETAADLVLLFETLRHELGHVLGIDRHAKSESAVMAAVATRDSHWFQEEDAELFFGANPDFAIPAELH